MNNILTITPSETWQVAWQQYNADLAAGITARTVYSWPCPMCADETFSVATEMASIAGVNGGLCGHCASDAAKLELHRRRVGAMDAD